jgi:hypothetical protein
MAKLTSALTLVVWLASLGTLHAQESAKPLGKWERKIGKNHATLTIEENRLHLDIQGAKPCAVHADYSMTRDGIIYGIVTSVECSDEEAEDNARLILDAPFSCRYRIDEGALIVRDLKCQEMGSKEEMWNGRFNAVNSSETHRARRSYFVPSQGTSMSSAPPGSFSLFFMTSEPSQFSSFISGYTR